ncbi:Uncharacterised protein [Veillonella atypica]|nr:Uncharacterised protein [Veillonella atypica]
MVINAKNSDSYNCIIDYLKTKLSKYNISSDGINLLATIIYDNLKLKQTYKDIIHTGIINDFNVKIAQRELEELGFITLIVNNNTYEHNTEVSYSMKLTELGLELIDVNLRTLLNDHL